MLADIDGVGTATAKRLTEAGIVSIYDLASCSSTELSVLLDCNYDKANTIISNAHKVLRDNNMMQGLFITASEVERMRQSIDRLSTGSKSLDNMLNGIETKAVTEFYGEFGSGKSQLCHTIAVMTHQPKSEGGLDGGVIYLDTEGTFRPERLRQIATSRGYDPDKVMNNTITLKLSSASQLEIVIKRLAQYIEQFKVRLVVVDSITNLHRAEFLGRGTLSDRQQRLAIIMHKLLRLAEVYNIAVVITNQVITNPDTYFADPTKAVGGNVIAHASTYRIYLRKAGANRIAKIIDSPSHPQSECKIIINESGIDDISTD